MRDLNEGSKMNSSLRSIRDPELYRDREYVEYYGASQDNFLARLCKDLVLGAKLKPTDIVADLGCGTGYATREIVRSGVKKVYAIDPSKEMLAGSCGNLDSCIIINGTIDDLIATNLERPDVILSSGVFVVMQNPEQEFQKIFYYLRKGRRHIFTVEDWENSSVDGEDSLVFIARVSDLEQSLGLDSLKIDVSGGKTYSEEEVLSMINFSGGKLKSVSKRRMSYSALDDFSWDFRMNNIQAELSQIQNFLSEERSVGKSLRLLRQRERLLLENKKLETVKSLYLGKEWTIGTQYIYETEKK